MKKIDSIIAGVLMVGVVTIGAVTAHAGSGAANRPAGVLADGTTDLRAIPDTERVPYSCWSGKMVTMDGKTFKRQMTAHPMPGSEAYELGVAKSKELSAIPGVVTQDGRGGQVFAIDDTNPAVQKVMQKYEAKEMPQCQ